MTRIATHLIATNERGGKTMLQRKTFLLRFFTLKTANHPCTVAQSHVMSRTTSWWPDRAERRV